MELTTTLDCWRRGVDERIAALLHVLHRIDEFFDAYVCYTPPQAPGTHSLHLLDRVLNRLSTHDATEPAFAKCWCRRAMTIAIKHGDLDMVQRVHAYHPCPLGSNVFATAAECGHLPVLQWLFHHRSDGLCQLEPPHRFTNGEMTCCMSQLISIASENEQFADAKWLFLTGCTNKASDLGDLAAEHGDLEFIKVLHERQIP